MTKGLLAFFESSSPKANLLLVAAAPGFANGEKTKTEPSPVNRKDNLEPPIERREFKSRRRPDLTHRATNVISTKPVLSFSYIKKHDDHGI